MPTGLIKLLQEGLSSWRVYLSTRQEAYERGQDKKMKKAMMYAGVCFRRLSELRINPSDKRFLQAKKKFYKFRGKV